MLKIGLVLAGCGAKDGSEIHESTLALLGLVRAGAQVQCLAPNRDQARVIDHFSEEVATNAHRNMLVEAARIGRGEVTDLAKVSEKNLDALVIPGGFGVAYNLCDYAEKGPLMAVDSVLTKLITEFHSQGKPIGAICISPIMVAKVLGGLGLKSRPKVTLGNDPEAAGHVREFGAEHVDCAVDQCVVDHTHRIVTTPAYMLGKNISDIYPGIEKLAREIVALAKGTR